MTVHQQLQEPLVRRGALLAMCVVVMSSFGWNAWLHQGPHLVLGILGVVFLLGSTLGWMWSDRRGPRAIAAWLVMMTALAFAACWVSQFSVMIILMPLIALAVVYFGIQWGIVLTALVLAFLVVFNAQLGLSVKQIYSNSTGFIPGAVFVIVFSLVVVRERNARQQIRRYAAEDEELATTRERNRIARDIHDSVGHYLTVVNVQIEAARATVATDTTASTECLSRAQELAREGLAELRRSVSILRGGAVEQRAFGVALASIVDQCKTGGLDATLAVHGTPRALTPALEFTLFRAAQEALTNIMRHA
ncbi:MAG: sensor histidine kinase, partial [Kofleriaceae bacterium]